MLLAHNGTHKYMKAYLSMIITAISLLLLSCSTQTTPVYLLSTSVEPVGSGIITPEQGEFEQGDSITMTATPNEHWVFLRWEGDFSGAEQTFTMVMDNDKTVSAVFVKREYPLSVEVEGQGFVSERIVQQKSTEYEAETTVELTAEASEGWHFSHWGGDLDGNVNPINITIDSEKTVKAVFVRNDYPLTINIVGNGTVTETVVQTKSTDYPYQTVVELKANPDEGWVFSEWQGDLAKNENPAQIEITGSSEVTAIFTKDYFDVLIDLEGQGMISIDLMSGNQSEGKFEYESEVNISVAPSSGWFFQGWEGDLAGSTNPVTIVVNGPVSATAVLQQTPFEGNGTVQSPFQIKTLEELQMIRESKYLDKHFVQMNNIDATATAGWNNGEGFIPIGFMNTNRFTGSYDGGGFQISGLKINNKNSFNVTEYAFGLFGFSDHATIKNLDLENVDIDGVYAVGGLVGFASNGSRIENVNITGSVNGDNYVGGLVGTLINSEVNAATTQVMVQGDTHIGGMIGYSNNSSVNAAISYGEVSGNEHVGGLIGYQDQSKMITYSTASGNVSGQSNVGGLIGASFNTAQMIRYTGATGNVSGDQNAGGLVGIYSGEGVITDTYATGNVLSNNGTYIGGLVGRTTAGKIYKSYALGEVSGKTGIGGLVGRNDTDGHVIESFSAGKVTGTSSYGGLVGQNQGVVNASYWDKNTSGQTEPVWDPYQGVTDAAGLTTPQMTGANAKTNMPKFDWDVTWKTTNGYPTLKQ